MLRLAVITHFEDIVHLKAVFWIYNSYLSREKLRLFKINC